MAQKLQPLKVSSIKKTTDDCSIVTFDIDESLHDRFKFIQGQYLTLEASIDGESVRRSYSLCTSPIDQVWSVAIKKVEGGKFSTYANEVLHVGDELMVMPPDGKFHKSIEPEKSNNYIAFAAGSGITPILSIIKTHLELEPNATFTLFYVNQTVSSIILKEEIEGLKNKYMERLEIFHFLTREFRSAELFNGRLSKDKLDQIFADIIDVNDVNDAFICGPTEMIFLVKDYLLEHGMDVQNVHFELFGTGNTYKNKKKTTKIQSDRLSSVRIKDGGTDIIIKMPLDGEDNILDAALRNNADLPYACKGGVCCTCRAKLLEGKVDMAVTYGLEPDEIDNGYILTCQAIPKSEEVIVEFG